MKRATSTTKLFRRANHTRARRALLFALLFALPSVQARAQTTTPVFGEQFWNHWGDGNAELSGYQITYPRYGEMRSGTAVAVFVTETFSRALRVKADPGVHPKSDEFPVMKLNLSEDFPTGVYDYNMMTSSFVSLSELLGRPPGSLSKVSFSSQEWCGHGYSQLLFDKSDVRLSSHSYFDKEADQRTTLPYPEHGLSEDGLFLWARGFAGPVLAPGQSLRIPLLRSLAESRLRHVSLAWQNGTVSLDSSLETISVPGGTFSARRLQAAVDGGHRWTFYVDDSFPHRIVKWTRSDGYSGELLKSKRMKYWAMNAERFSKSVKDLGLTPRPARTP